MWPPHHLVQEGLTAYIEWLISDETGLVTLQGKVQEVMSSTFRGERQPIRIVGPMNYTQVGTRAHTLWVYFGLLCRTLPTFALANHR